MLYESFCAMVRFGLSLGIKRTVRIGGTTDVPLSKVTFKDKQMYIGEEDARTFHSEAHAGTSGEGLPDTSTNSASSRRVATDHQHTDAPV